jgi:hypothetical protein
MTSLSTRSALACALALAAPLAAPRALALPLLSEVLYDATGADDGLVFVEIYGAAGTSLEGYVLEGVNGTDGSVTVSVALGGAIPADGVFVVADAASAGGTLVPEADLVLNFDLQNGPDSVVLRDALGAAVDALGYGEFLPGEVFAGEGSPAPDAPAGSSLARVFADVDTGDNAADFAVLDVPTPGTAPLSTVPEPGAALLVLTGLAGLGAFGRR